jgi:hypothetical protein
VKKITAILLTTVYLLSAIGVSATSFYCCGVLRSTSLSIGDLQSKDTKATAKANNCCKTTKQSFKVKDNHFGSGSISLLTKIFPALNQPVIIFNLNTKSFTSAHAAFNSHAPPFRQHEPIYVLNCTYRI